MSTINIRDGKTYTFKNAGTRKFLNLYAGNTANGTNVCQYPADGSDEQKWTRHGDKLYTYGSTTKCLDRYKMISSEKHNNADIWTNTDTENQVLIFDGANGYVRILLRYVDDHYLRASVNSGTVSQMNSYGNTDEYKEPEATGNVYWSDDPVDAYACWEAELVPEEDDQVTDFPTYAYFSDANASYKFDNGLVGECTWYCNGRAMEKKARGNICAASAGSWYANADASLQRLGPNADPVADSIGCFTKHVVYIEKVTTENGTKYVYFTEANWYDIGDSRRGNHQYESEYTDITGTDGVLKKMKLSDFKNNRPGGGTYQGCIVL